MKHAKLPFKPRARLLLLLGNQLIRDAGIAVFELVKNAYDADSPHAVVTMSQIHDRENGVITVDDLGTGMDFATVTGVWLEPGTDYRAEQQRQGQRTEKFNRLPLGEKGVGRFAAHKLGSKVKLITRRQECPEIIVEIDWSDFGKKKNKYLADILIDVQEREPEVFTGNSTGTRIEVRQLRDTWTRGMVRNLARSITAICSPFDEEGEFKAILHLTDNQGWLDGLLTTKDVLDYSLFQAVCELEGKELSYIYQFTPFPAMDKITPRTSERLGANSIDLPVDVNLSKYTIGRVQFDLHIFDLERNILALGVTDKRGLRDFLAVSGGIRVYRDGIRVYDYGEPGNDWLNLGGRRVNVPASRISNNLVIGAVSLNHETSQSLVEKTNREGFVENEAFRGFRKAISFAIVQIETERNQDKLRIRNAYSQKQIKEPVLHDLTQLKQIIEEKGLTREVGSFLDRIEADFILIRDRYLLSASAGLSLSVVIHEVEKSIADLTTAIETDSASLRITNLAKHLADLVEGFASLLRRSGIRKENASALVRSTLFNTELRLKAHKIKMIVNVDEHDTIVKCSRRLTISTLMNLIDNSIWWLDNKWGRDNDQKRIYIGVSNEFQRGPAIVVADNGPGFSDPPEYLIEPFISRKPDGMGLGLHIADQVMKTQKTICFMIYFNQNRTMGENDGICTIVVNQFFLR